MNTLLDADADVVSSGTGTFLPKPALRSSAEVGMTGQSGSRGVFSTRAAQRLGAMAVTFDELLRDHRGLLSRVIASYEATPTLQEDLFQEVAVAIWRALPTWRGEASIKTFVARVAHNLCVTHVIRNARHDPEMELQEDIADPGRTPEAYAQLAQNAQRLQSAVRTLPLGLRQTVTLALEGFSHQEIGETLGITTNNVDVRLNRARNALKTILREPT